MIFVYFSIAFNLLPETEAEKVEKKLVVSGAALYTAQYFQRLRLM